MDFRLLGPLEVRDGDRAVDLGPPKQRALLALLLLDNGRVVSVDRLIDALWGDDPPPSAVAAVQIYVSKLRRALEPHRRRGEPSRLLETRAPGYVVRVEPDQLDLHRFERLAEEGRAALREGRADQAASILRDALALWRGPALGDLALEPFAAAEVSRLDELRLAALEDRVEADLAAGRHEQSVAELDALVAGHPLRERPRRQLMLALYRSGRQAEALAAYQDGRRLLVEELGIEPGRDLQRLNQQILEQDPALDLDRPAAAPTPPAPLATPPGPVAAPAAEERKLVTVVVAELTEAGEAEPDPERMRARLDRYADAMETEIREAGGTAESPLGHVVTGVFGAPAAQQDHAERALRAALAMRLRFTELFDAGASLGIGVESGEAVVARTDAGRVSIAGEVSIRAAALARAAEHGAVLAGDRAVSAAGHGFEFGEPIPSDAGEGRRLTRGRPLARLRQAARRQGRSAAFVGRESELELLEATYRRVVRESEPHLVTIVGEAGVGKSRLAAELQLRMADTSPQPVRMTGRCLAYGRAITYWPLREILREHLGISGGESPDDVLERLRGREILALALGLDVARDLHPFAARERHREAWADLLNELVADRPAALLVEDLHWAEEPLLELLERIAHEVEGPLMILVTARPELLDRSGGWPGSIRNATMLWLDPLAASAAEQLLEELLPQQAPAPLRGAVLERAEGNPFFVEEIVGRLVDARLLEGAEGHLGPADVERAMPDSVQAALAARIDLLPEPEKAALQAAAVVGRTFPAAAVTALLGLEPDFSVLESRDFLRRRRAAVAGESDLAFKHALTRDVAYGSLPRARRLQFHADFAAWLEEAGQGRSEHAALLAHHYTEAVATDGADMAWEGNEEARRRVRGKAVQWLQRAAELAIGRYELGEGVALLERALSLEPSPSEEVRIWRAIGRANALRYDGEGLWLAMGRAIERCSDVRVRAELYSELAIETAIRSGIWRRRPEQERVNRWIDQALELAEPNSAARAKALIARSNFSPSLAAEAAQEARAIVGGLDDPDLSSWAWDACGIGAFVSGDYDKGREYEERRLEMVDEITDPDHVADIHYGPVSGYAWVGRFDDMRRQLRRHDQLAASLSPHHRLHGVAALVEAEELAAGWERVRQLAPRAERDVAASLDTPCARGPRSLLVCALAKASIGDEPGARRLEEAAEDLGLEGYGHVLAAPRMRLALLRGDLDEVERLLAEGAGVRIWHRGWLAISTHAARIDALAALRKREDLAPEHWPHVKPGTYLEPFLLRALGLVEEDETLIERARDRFDVMGLQSYGEQTLQLSR